MRGVRHWGGCDWHVAGGSRARVWGRGEVFPRGEPRSHPEVSPRGENLRCRYFGTVPQIVGGNGLPVRDCARYRGDVRPCWVQPIYTMSDTSRGRQRGARTRGGAARGAAPTADPGGAPGTANPMVADRLDDSSLGPATRPGAEPRARSPSLAGRVAATVRGLASGGGMRPPSASRGDGDGRSGVAAEQQEIAPDASARAVEVSATLPPAYENLWSHAASAAGRLNFRILRVYVVRFIVILSKLIFFLTYLPSFRQGVCAVVRPDNSGLCFLGASDLFAHPRGVIIRLIPSG